VCVCVLRSKQKQTSSSYSDLITLPPVDHPSHQPATHPEPVIESNGVNVLWIVAPICAAIVLCLLIVLLVVVARLSINVN